MTIIFDFIMLIFGCLCWYGYFALSTSLPTLLRICGTCSILLSVASFFLFSKLRILEMIIIAVFVIWNICNYWLHVDGKNSQCPEMICVPGSLVVGTKVMKTFQGRLDLAFRQYQKYDKKPSIIVCGSVGVKSTISEAEAGINYLVSLGVPSEKLIAEETSRNTLSSLFFCSEMLPYPGARMLITTSNWGILRAYILARKIGLNAKAMGARTPFQNYFCYTLREFFSLLYNLTKKNDSRL